MILTCPACDAQYLLPDDAIGPKGRRVKCTTCGHLWQEKPLLPVLEEADPIDPTELVIEHDPDARMSVSFTEEPPSIERRLSFTRQIASAFLITALLTGLTLGAAVVWRKALVAKWPPSALLFEALHMPIAAPGQGLAFKDVVVMKADPTLLRIKGKLQNPGKTTAILPNLIIRLNSASGWLKDWPVSLHDKALAAGKEVSFEYEVHQIPQGVQSVTLLFAD